MSGFNRGLGVALALGTAVVATTVGADALSPAERARLKALDSGPKKIDVSKYPAEQKAAYPLFVKKCVKCHSLGRAINTGFSLPEEWQRYIKRMMYKPNSKLSEDDAKIQKGVPEVGKEDPTGPDPPLRMPAYRDLIAGQEMQDLTAYLYSLGPKKAKTAW